MSNKNMNVYFIAIGGAAMHNLAIALHKRGYRVTGSDDEIFEPSRSRLDKYGLLPKSMGWNPDHITSNLDVVILGMHARNDNPELIKAKELNLKIYSYPEFVYEETKSKQRIVVGGSHGKTTITSMIMHVLKYHNIPFDYLVGSIVEGFETMVGLEKDSKFAVIEGDEYLSSPMDPRPKFLHYKPHVAIISGIAWDHINVFPTFDNYVEQFRLFAQSIQPEGELIYYKHDEHLTHIAQSLPNSVKTTAYEAYDHEIREGITFLKTSSEKVALKIFGTHNLENLKAACLACNKAGISETDFATAISTFRGAGKRLQHLASGTKAHLFLDFAHSPSKLKATVNAVKAQYPGYKLFACMELHTFSSLSKDFLNQYKGSMDKADVPVVYFNPNTIAHKRLDAITPDDVRQGFENKHLRVITDGQQLSEFLKQQNFDKCVLLLMSSGNFEGLDLKMLEEQINK